MNRNNLDFHLGQKLTCILHMYNFFLTRSFVTKELKDTIKLIFNLIQFFLYENMS